MLKHRLIFGTLMTLAFIVIVVFDGWIDGSLTTSEMDDKPLQGIIFCILICLLIIAAQIEFSALARLKGFRIFLPVSITASILFATGSYWLQFIPVPPYICLLFISVFTLLSLLLYQYIYFQTAGVIANCGANYFSIVYLGLFSSFVIGIRLDFGIWALLMFVFAIKFSDIGAYTAGKLWGKHKFSPSISPAKTWEGMAGAAAAGIIVAVGFAGVCDIMSWQAAAVFGFCFAFIGQMGDLVESMIKRDAQQKDSADNVPGFGGILDIIDSPLFAAPLAYLYFMCSC